jgi:hypothetical protein
MEHEGTRREQKMTTTHDCAPETCGFDLSERFTEPRFYEVGDDDTEDVGAVFYRELWDAFRALYSAAGDVVTAHGNMGHVRADGEILQDSVDTLRDTLKVTDPCPR